MGITFCGLVLLAICTARTVAADSCLRSEFKDEVSIDLWDSLFTKMIALGESQNAVTESLRALGEDQNALTESQKPLSEGLRALSEEQKTLTESQKAITESQKALNEGQKAISDSIRALSENQKALSESLRALSDDQKALTESQKAITESQKAISESLAELKEKHEAQGLKLSEFMADTEQMWSIYEERQLLQTSKANEFIQSSEENFKGIKQGLAEQQRNLSYFLDLYLTDNNVGWTTILRRQDGSVDFNRNWREYKKGFGNADGEFFIGLEKLHKLTTKGAPKELLIILKDNENEKRIAKYDLLKIGNETEEYALLELGAYSGDAGDSLGSHKGISFSTYDQDNDKLDGINFGLNFHGGWWFLIGFSSNLFGEYKGEQPLGIKWKGWKELESVKFAEMKIRPKITLAV